MFPIKSIISLLIWASSLVSCQYLKSTYQSRSSYLDRVLLDSPYNLCQTPLMPRSQNSESTVTATSEASQREANRAFLWDGSAWTAENSDFDQALIVDLGTVKNVTGIATQGRAHSNEYVMEFRIQYGSNGKDWIDYKEVDGSPKLFTGNENGDYVIRNTFNQPIIAKWVRINPTRWQDRISMRMELYGCDYISDELHFDGNSIVTMEKREPVASLRDIIRLRFKTNKENGVLVYSRGSQGDYIALQLVENRLLLNINLGHSEETSLSLGSLMDDGAYHDVEISRERRDVVLSVDRVKIRDRIKGHFHKLNLDKKFYIGGVPHIEKGLVVFDNFTGCIENMYLNHSSVSAGYLYPLKYDFQNILYDTIGNEVTKGCKPDPFKTPVTFKNSKSFVRLPGYTEGSENLDVSLEFRTYEENGLLVYHHLNSEGFVKLFMEDARIKVTIVSADMPQVELDTFDQTYNDGKWHKLELKMKRNQAVLNIDEEPMETVRILQIATGSYYMIGGGIYDSRGFIGCMRQIRIDGNYKLPIDWKDEEISSPNDFIIESCQTVDRCTPNPCEHGGICKQNSEEFYCECENTGYTGAVCHTSLNFLSCVQYKHAHPESSYAETIIDVDGSGPLAPFNVRCEFFPDGRNITYVDHLNEEGTKVDGYEGPGEFKQEIHYKDTTLEMMEALINRSISCVQKLGYDCKASRLLGTPTDSQNFQPFGYWISRQNRIMDYWAGSLPGSMKCECGLLGVCVDPTKWCNCDSGFDDWNYDGGELTQKEHLPVRAVAFGDTGDPLDVKEGRYTLGPLECDGDALFDNVVTFRKDDGFIRLPTFDMGLSGDIYFEFKTTSEKTMIIIHSQGENGDFIKVSLISGNHIQFEYDSGKGPQGVTVETAYRLDDDTWHTVLVEKNRKEAMVVVDGARKGQVNEPRGPVRPMILDGGLYVGATRDAADGFVGCMRALMLNGVIVDLVKESRKDPYGIGLGCQGKCHNNPCMNGGECQEGYDHFKCDCRWTPFKGPICADEIGINMRTDNMIVYEFKGNYKSTIAEKLHVGFTTTDPKGFLIGLYSEVSKEFLTLMVSNSGHLRLTFDFGFERQEVVFTDQNFLTGQYHDVKVERFDQGRKVMMKIDNYEPEIYDFSTSLKSSADAQFNSITHMYVGKNRTMAEGFVGCISRVEFDEIIPLKLYFQEDSSKLGNIEAYKSNIPTTLTEDFCGIEPVTLPPEEPETRRPPEIDEEKLKEKYPSTNSGVMGAILALLFIVIVVVCVCIGRLKTRQRGEYLTREDEGAHDAFDADTAVLQGPTGHPVEKKREWFI